MCGDRSLSILIYLHPKISLQVHDKSFQYSAEKTVLLLLVLSIVKILPTSGQCFGFKLRARLMNFHTSL